MRSLKVGFAYNVNNNADVSGLKAQSELDFDTPEVINSIKCVIESLGHTVIMFEADENAFEKLKNAKGKIDIVFNIAEGLYGDARESQIPLFCEILKIPYTHSSPTTHALKLNKKLAKLAVKGMGFHVPETYDIGTNGEIDEKIIKYPVIVKPNKEGSSKGIMDQNLVFNTVSLKERLAFLSDNFTKEIIVEEYIDGREFTVSMLGDKNPKILPIIEQLFDFVPKEFNKIASYEVKWIYEYNIKDIGEAYGCPAKISSALKKKITDISRQTYTKLEVRDCARIDYRMDSMENLYFLEINTLPGINPNEKYPSYFTYSVLKSGMSYKDLINQILTSACARFGI